MDKDFYDSLVVPVNVRLDTQAAKDGDCKSCKYDSTDHTINAMFGWHPAHGSNLCATKVCIRDMLKHGYISKSLINKLK